MAKTTFSSPIAVVEIRIEGEECNRCGVIYGLTNEFIKQRQKDGQTWYCPNGHSWFYNGGKTQDRVRAEEAEHALAEERDRVRRLRDSNEQLANDVMDKAKELKRLKARSRAGVCLQCRRPFEALARHMKTKHPEVPKA